MVNDKCLYFERTERNRTDARTNSANEMAKYGKGTLLEPESFSMCEMVTKKAYEIAGRLYLHIGVNDIITPDPYVYESNSVPISFTPNWFRPTSIGNNMLYGNKNKNYKCTFLSSYTSGIGFWIDHPCSLEWYSVCE